MLYETLKEFIFQNAFEGYLVRHFSKYFSTTGKRYWKLDLELSYEIQSLHVFFSFLFLKHPWKFFYSIHLYFLLFRYLQTCIKESFMYFSSQRFFKPPHKTLKLQEKCIFQRSADLNFKKSSFGVYRGGHPTGPLN